MKRITFTPCAACNGLGTQLGLYRWANNAKQPTPTRYRVRCRECSGRGGAIVQK